MRNLQKYNSDFDMSDAKYAAQQQTMAKACDYGQGPREGPRDAPIM